MATYEEWLHPVLRDARMAARARPPVGLRVVVDVYEDGWCHCTHETGEVVAHVQGSNVQCEIVPLFKVRYEMVNPASIPFRCFSASARWAAAEEVECFFAGCARMRATQADEAEAHAEQQNARDCDAAVAAGVLRAGGEAGESDSSEYEVIVYDGS